MIKATAKSGSKERLEADLAVAFGAVCEEEAFGTTEVVNRLR